MGSHSLLSDRLAHMHLWSQAGVCTPEWKSFASEASQHLPNLRLCGLSFSPAAGLLYRRSDGTGNLCLHSDPSSPITKPQSGSFL